MLTHGGSELNGMRPNRTLLVVAPQRHGTAMRERADITVGFCLEILRLVRAKDEPQGSIGVISVKECQ
jgi:hypothetical protein